MKYGNIIEGVFLQRPNRFIALIKLRGEIETVHVKNTGRCGEILLPGAKAWVQQSDNPKRKTKFDLITVQKGDRLINIDSQAPNSLFREWVELGNFPEKITEIRPEYKWGTSRFDFHLMSGQREILTEVKGVTLERDGKAYFPDAPTIRGARHLRELKAAAEMGIGACLCFIVQMEDIQSVSPNTVTDPDFAQALRAAADSGVRIMAVGCDVTENTVTPKRYIDVIM